VIDRVEYLASVVDEDIPELTNAVRKQLKSALERNLASHPIEFGTPLRYSLKGARRLRAGEWRVIYKIEPLSIGLVVKIGRRREIYEK
jgi:mRNA-degrading endonuclease RelE of RelBE toxin-antitoxin system